MKSKHSKEPWTLRADKNSFDTNVVCAEEYTIARVLAGDAVVNKSLSADNADIIAAVEEQAKNAALIVAAPDMLLMLKQCLKHLRKTEFDEMDDDTLTLHRSIRDVICNATTTAHARKAENEHISELTDEADEAAGNVRAGWLRQQERMVMKRQS